jgi:hypothetical protein
MKSIQVGDRFTYLPSYTTCTVVGRDQWSVNMLNYATGRTSRIALSNIPHLYRGK